MPYPKVSAADLVDTVGMDAEKISVIHNPVISSRLFAEAKGAEHPSHAHKVGPVLLAVGRLTAQKDFATLLRAVALLPRIIGSCVLGEGELRDELLELAERLAIRGIRRPPGFVANPYPSFASADVVVLSFAIERNCQPFSSRRFRSRAGSCQPTAQVSSTEILDGGRWGRLVPCGDPVALADAINAEISSHHAAA